MRDCRIDLRNYHSSAIVSSSRGKKRWIWFTLTLTKLFLSAKNHGHYIFQTTVNSINCEGRFVDRICVVSIDSVCIRVLEITDDWGLKRLISFCTGSKYCVSLFVRQRDETVTTACTLVQFRIELSGDQARVGITYNSYHGPLCIWPQLCLYIQTGWIQ